MKFASNYSPQAAELVDRGLIEVDLFKCPEFPDLIRDVRERFPCYVHFPFRIGKRSLDAVDWEEARWMFDAGQARYWNGHLAPSIDDFLGMTLETKDAALRARVIGAMVEDTFGLSERFGAANVLLESVMWDPDPPWSVPAVALEADAIRQVVESTDTGFLLDLAHAAISARHLGLDEREYVASLPVDRIRELHVSGTRLDGDGLWQDHYPMADHDWLLFEWAIERIRAGDWPRPWLVTVEYGGVGPAFEARTDVKVLADQTPRLREQVASAQ